MSLDASAPGNGAGTKPARPDPEFEVVGARNVRSAAVPTLAFEASASNSSSLRVLFMALTAMITVEPGKRSYDDETRARLVELFGEPERWASTTGSFRWAQVGAVVPVTGPESRFELEVPCTYDHEIAAAKYFGGVTEGVFPLRFHFNGTVYYEDESGRLQIVPLPWDRSTRFELPAQVWREMIASHYPRGGWIRLNEDTLQELGRHKAATGTPTLDRCVSDLLDGARRDRGAG